ncbi:MAG: hypothetical protein JNJ49_14820, partial [Bdellovibrionaceae bacterium]|nr:hypothetical protein [Pseudobdellovibrionaceae bacterium]
FSLENIEHDVEEAMVVLADDLVDDFDDEPSQPLGVPGRGKSQLSQPSSHQTRASASKSQAESRKGNKRGKPARKGSVGVRSKMKPAGKGAKRPHGGGSSPKAKGPTPKPGKRK